MSAARKSTRTGSRGYAHLVEVNAPVARVWRALIDPGLIRIWSGVEAHVDARQGGVYRVGKPGPGARQSQIDIFDVNRRLRLIYSKDPKMPPTDTAIVDDFIFDVRNGKGTTSLRLLGSGFSEDPAWDRQYAHYRMSWERLMARIKVTLEKPPAPKKPEPKPDPGLPGLDY